MATGGGFSVAGDIPCPTQPMTHEEVVLLRDSGQLRVDCHYVIEDWIQGSTLTGPNLVELHAVSPSALSMDAKVFTPYDNEAWAGVYDIDLGAVGTMIELLDNRGNVAKDIDSGGTTVGAFPWGNANWRDNYAEDATLTAAGTQVGLITNCRFVGSTVDFTGKTAGAWTDTEVTAGATVTTGANMVATRATITAATVSNAGAGAFTLTDASVLDTTTTLVVTGAATGNKTLSAGTVIRDRFRMNITGTGTVTLQGSTFTGRGTHTSEAELGGSSGITISGTLVRPAFGAFAALDIQGSGSVSLTDGDMRESRVSAAAGSTAAVILSTFTFRRSSGVIVAATGTGNVNMVQGVYLAGGGILQNGAAPLSMNACQGNILMTGAAAATRGLTMTGCFGQQFNVTQNGTGSTNTDSILQSSGIGTTVINLNSTLAGTPSQSHVRLALTNGATLNVADPALAQPLDNSTIETQGTVNLQAGGSFVRCRVAGEATLNTGAFSHVGSVIEGQFTKTSTGANVNRLCNKAFDDWV